MAESDHLRLKDVRAVYRLIGECRELGRDPQAWRRHMLEGLRQLTGAQVALYLQLRDFGSNAERIVEALDAGFLSPSDRALWAHYQRENAHRDDPFHLRYYRNFTGALRTRRLESVVDMPEWRGSRHYNEYVRACGLDDRITSSLVAEGTSGPAVQVTVLHRAAADGRYPQRAIRLVHLFQEEIQPFIGRQLAARAGGSDARPLPPQLQHVLAGLLQGEAEKQIADRLQISRYTVNRHVQRLYRRFGVHSRGELMFRCRDSAGMSGGKLDG